MFDSRSRRWTVIASGLLCGALAVVVLFTNRRAFFSPLAVVVMGAVGLAAVLMQLRLQNRDQTQSSSSPAWLNVLGILFALAAFFGDLFQMLNTFADLLFDSGRGFSDGISCFRGVDRYAFNRRIVCPFYDSNRG